jgi:membrane protease YdiL (CAAX protease family)
MMDTVLIGIYILRISVLLTVVWVLHAKIGKYPAPLPSSKNPKREIREALFLWVFLFVFLSIFGYLVYSVGLLDTTDLYSTDLAIIWSLVNTAPSLAVPLLFVLFVNKWNASDLGITTKINQKRVWAYVILIQILLIIAELSIRGKPTSKPLFFLLMSLYGTVILEEFLHRGVIQSKLERALGQNKGWFYGGILFGLAHIPANFFVDLWAGGSVDVTTGLLLLGGQTVNGWWFGITYAKTRSLLPPIILHYMADFLIYFLAWSIV